MERHASALKAARQAVRHRVRNNAVRSSCTTAVKKLEKALSEGLKGEEATKAIAALLNKVQSELMKAAKRNVIRKGNAARTISRLSSRVSAATSGK